MSSCELQALNGDGTVGTIHLCPVLPPILMRVFPFSALGLALLEILLPTATVW